MEEEIIDKLDQETVKIGPLKAALSWWEKRRLWFNLAMLVSGMIPLVIYADTFRPGDGVGLFFYGLFFNILYSVGFLIEAWSIHYFKGKGMPNELQWILFLLGTIFSCGITCLGVIATYDPSPF